MGCKLVGNLKTLKLIKLLFMKTILQLKKLLIIPLLFLVGNVWGQTQYSGSPSTMPSACPSADVPGAICGTATTNIFYGGIVKNKINIYSNKNNKILYLLFLRII